MNDNTVIAENQERFDSVEKYFESRRSYWTEWIQKMSSMLKDMQTLPDLQSIVYSLRQEAVDNYHNIAETLAKRTKNYKIKHSQIYDNIKVIRIPNTPTYMYGNEFAVKQKLEGEMAADKYYINIIENHMQFIESTIKSIDGIIYSIQSRIRVEEIKIGK